MKYNRLLFVLFAIALFFNSCTNSPKSVAQHFIENMAKGKLSEAKKYGTEQTGRIIDMSSSLGAIPLNTDFEFKFEKEKVNGNSATIYFNNAKTIKLKNIDGKWLVHLTND